MLTLGVSLSCPFFWRKDTGKLRQGWNCCFKGCGQRCLDAEKIGLVR